MEAFNTYFLDVIKNKYAAFSGRARRKEFWMFVLIWNIIIILLSIVGSILGMIAGFLGTIFSLITLVVYLGTLVPFLALSFRRIQDTNNIGWFFLIPIYNIILEVTEGTKGDNQFGPDPKANENNNI